MIVLGIETSCDDTAVGIYCRERKVLASLRATQIEHREFGGIVPELASRVHLKNLPYVLRAALADAHLGLDEIDGIAVTRGPGLLGSLLVGLSFARALALSRAKPITGIHHIESHILANHLERDMVFPALALVVSGGHSQIIHLRGFGSYELLATTRDDAAGEAFDKVAKLLGLGFPGGPLIEERARHGDPGAIAFPVARLSSGGLDFSFSGLKTAARLEWEKRGESGEAYLNDFCASFQQAVIAQLLDRIGRAIRGRELRACYLAGGVAANRALAIRTRDLLAPLNLPVFAPSPDYCTDNGAMVACVGALHPERAVSAAEPLDAFSRGPLAS